MANQNNEDQELVERFVDAIEHLNHQIHSDRLDAWTSLEMTIPLVKTLVLLDTIGPMRMGALSGHLGSALSATTNVVDRLVERESWSSAARTRAIGGS